MKAPSEAVQSVFDERLGMFGNPEDAVLLDEVVSLAYRERRRRGKSSNYVPLLSAEISDDPER
jgi:hypothetical protein